MSQLKMYRPAELAIPELVLPEGVSIRSMRPGEETVWCECCLGEFGVETVGPEIYAKYMGEKNCFTADDVFFLFLDGKPVGTATARTTDEGAFLHYIAVKPEARGKRLVYPLITRVLLRHAEFGRYGCYLTTDDFRVPAVKGYLNMGYRPVLWTEDARERWEKMLRLYGMERVAAYEEDMTAAPDVIA